MRHEPMRPERRVAHLGLSGARTGLSVESRPDGSLAIRSTGGGREVVLCPDRACALGEALLGPWSGAPSLPPWLRRVALLGPWSGPPSVPLGLQRVPLPGIGERVRIEDPHGALELILDHAEGACEIRAGQPPELERIALLDDREARRLGALLLAAQLAGRGSPGPGLG